MIPNLSTLTPSTDSRYQWRFCAEPGCNAVFLSVQQGIPQDYCEQHRDLHSDLDQEARLKRRGKKRLRRYAGDGRTRLWHVISDPTGEWTNREFESLDFLTSLGNRVWPTGMQVEFRGRHYTIQQNALVDANGRRRTVYAGGKRERIS